MLFENFFLLKSDLKKLRIFHIWGQSDPRFALDLPPPPWFRSPGLFISPTGQMREITNGFVRLPTTDLNNHVNAAQGLVLGINFRPHTKKGQNI